MPCSNLLKLLSMFLKCSVSAVVQIYHSRAMQVDPWLCDSRQWCYKDECLVILVHGISVILRRSCSEGQGARSNREL
uniref:Secreted protein n=1 Tax=Arundo donax TaxID=35708 RepID=A0A0A9FJS3_ARUDO